MSLPPDDPRESYVDTAELAKLLGVAPDDPRLERVAAATDRIVDGYYGAATVAAKLPAPPWPAAVQEAALTIATDLWRRPTTPGGYFQVADYVGRLSLDPAAPVVILLDSIGRLEWPIA
jgi:hypothetical protein